MLISGFSLFGTGSPPIQESGPATAVFTSVYNLPADPFGHEWDTGDGQQNYTEGWGGDVITVWADVDLDPTTNLYIKYDYCNHMACYDGEPGGQDDFDFRNASFVLGWQMNHVGGTLYNYTLLGDWMLGYPTYPASTYSGIHIGYTVYAKNATDGSVVVGELYHDMYPYWPASSINVTSSASKTVLSPGENFWVNGSSNYWHRLNWDGNPPARDCPLTVSVNPTYNGTTDAYGNFSMMIPAPMTPGFYDVNTTVTNSTPNRNAPCISTGIPIEVQGGAPGLSINDVHTTPKHPFGHDWNTLQGGDEITLYADVSSSVGIMFVNISYGYANRWMCYWGEPGPPIMEGYPMTPENGTLYSYQMAGDWAAGLTTYEASYSTFSYVMYNLWVVETNGNKTRYPAASDFYIYPAWPPTQINATSQASKTILSPGETFWVNGTSNYWNSTSYPGNYSELIPVANSDVTISINPEYNGTTDENGDYSVEVTAPMIPGNYTVNTTVSNSTPNRNVTCVSNEINIAVVSPYTPHAPIRINSNADFDAAHGVVNWATGNGTQGNPWIIEGWDINGTGYGYCLYIGNTTEHFEIKYCNLHWPTGFFYVQYYDNANIYLHNVKNGLIRNNSCWAGKTFWSHGIYSESSDLVIVNNNILEYNRHGLYLIFSDNHTIDDNTIRFNDNIGIILDHSCNNLVHNNLVSENKDSFEYGTGLGIMDWANNNTISNNTITNNGLSMDDLGYGIYCGGFSCWDNSIINNTIANHDFGIQLYEWNNTLIYHNNFTNNEVQAFDNGFNFWDNGYPSGGNYWSDYNGTDNFSGPGQNQTGSDGIGDTPYTNIQGGSGAQDNYPLMEPWGIPGSSPFELSLSLGWNLISLPLVQSNESIMAVLQSISGNWDYIQAYNPLSTDPWKSYSIHRPASMNELQYLDHTMGFWINITSANVSLTVQGSVPNSTSINLYAGWNLVGYPTLVSDTVANALWGTGADIVMVCDTSEPYNIREIGPNYLMKPGEGYWVHVPFDTVWVVDW